MEKDKRDLEEEYFRKQDQELIEKMRKVAAADEARRAMGTESGITDPALLQELEQLGFTPDTVRLLPLVPILQVAWAEGGVSPEERKLILEVARARGIGEGSPADRQLQDWMTTRPSPQVFTRAGRLINAMLSAHASETGALTADDLLKYAESIAAASGGIFGMNKISKEERAAIAQLQKTLRNR
jgi:hypothetical protein